jgi:hypothetical protein
VKAVLKIHRRENQLPNAPRSGSKGQVSGGASINIYTNQIQLVFYSVQRLAGVENCFTFIGGCPHILYKFFTMVAAVWTIKNKFPFDRDYTP